MHLPTQLESDQIYKVDWDYNSLVDGGVSILDLYQNSQVNQCIYSKYKVDFIYGKYRLPYNINID